MEIPINKWLLLKIGNKYIVNRILQMAAPKTKRTKYIAKKVLPHIIKRNSDNFKLKLSEFKFGKISDYELQRSSSFYTLIHIVMTELYRKKKNRYDIEEKEAYNEDFLYNLDENRKRFLLF